jgi:iron(III) transport system substrate-binding protein
MKKLITICLSLVLFTPMMFANGSQESAQDKEPTEVIVWSAAAEEEAQALVQKFEELHPEIKVSVIRAGSGELLTRLNAEQPKPQGDIILGIAKESFDTAYDLFQPYKTANHDLVASTARDNKDIPSYYGYSMPLQALMINTDKLSEDEYPKTWKDLADPKFEGQIVLANPALSGSAYAQVYMMYKLYGMDFLQQLANNATFTTSSHIGPESVARGEYSITATGENNIAEYIESGDPVTFVYPEEGTGARFDASGIIKNGPNPKAAEMFMDFLTSEEAYTIILNTRNRRVVIPTLPGPKFLPALDEIKLFEYDAVEAAEMRADLTDKISEMIM